MSVVFLRSSNHFYRIFSVFRSNLSRPSLHTQRVLLLFLPVLSSIPFSRFDFLSVLYLYRFLILFRLFCPLLLIFIVLIFFSLYICCFPLFFFRFFPNCFVLNSFFLIFLVLTVSQFCIFSVFICSSSPCFVFSFVSFFSSLFSFRCLSIVFLCWFSPFSPYVPL